MNPSKPTGSNGRAAQHATSQVPDDEGDPREQARSGLSQVNRICLILQALQFAAATAILALGFFLLPGGSGPVAWGFEARTIQLYAVCMAFLMIVFAHTVVSYVFFAMAKHIHQLLVSSPSALTNALNHAVQRSKKRVVPLVAAHGALYLAIVLSILMGFDATSGAAAGWKKILFHSATAAGVAAGVYCLFVVRNALRTNSAHLTEYLEMGMASSQIVAAGRPDA